MCGLCRPCRIQLGIGHVDLRVVGVTKVSYFVVALLQGGSKHCKKLVSGKAIDYPNSLTIVFAIADFNSNYLFCGFPMSRARPPGLWSVVVRFNLFIFDLSMIGLSVLTWVATFACNSMC